MIITVANQKGGVGKTDLAVNLSATLAKKGKKVLLLDMDPQANATTYLTGKKHRKTTSALLLNGKLKIKDIAVKTSVENLFIAPGSPELYATQIELLNDVGMQFKLKKKLSAVKDYDYIIIDTPPSLGLLTLNALTASSHVMIPVQVNYFALDGVEKVMNTIHKVREDLNPDLDVKGLVLTMYDKRNNLSSSIEGLVRGSYGDKVFDTVIPINVDLSISPSKHEPITISSKESRGAYAYQNLAEELLNIEGG
ncbi:MAG: ParA family protein [Candidatus Aenigmarchaeota archaeon]|nr:ParA family protein [Candidatus Aenigmarchaeota archaeon]